MIIFTLVVFYIFKKRIISSLQEMAQFATLVEQGNYDQRLNDKSTNETGILARALNKMASSIAQNITQREQEMVEFRKLSSAVEQSSSVVIKA